MLGGAALGMDSRLLARQGLIYNMKPKRLLKMNDFGIYWLPIDTIVKQKLP